MCAYYRLTCKEKDPILFRTKCPAHNMYRLYKSLNYTDVELKKITKGFSATIYDRYGYHMAEVKIGSKDISECDETDVLIDDMRSARFKLRAGIRQRECIVKHLAMSTSPLTSKDTPNHADPEDYTVTHLISPLLNSLGYTRSDITRLGGNKKAAGASDLLLNVNGFRIVVEAKPMDVSCFEPNSLQVLANIADNQEEGCIGGIFTDGIHWVLATLVDGDSVRSNYCDLRQLLLFLFSKRPNPDDFRNYVNPWKEFTELFSADTIDKSIKRLRDEYLKQKRS